MITTQLYKCINVIIDDDYAMDVLYYSIRKTMIENNLSLEGLNAVRTYHDLLPEDISININHSVSNQIDSFFILLSIKALILHKEWFIMCNNDELLFKPCPKQKYEWIKYMSCIQTCIDDADFRVLVLLINKLLTGKCIDYTDTCLFAKHTLIPNKNEIVMYYRHEAANNTGRTKNVICNNAFVCDDKITNYIVSPSIRYVGNTAFAYCDRLTIMVFKNPHMYFGKFPIIECPHLKKIVVPPGSESYYKKNLPYYCEIIVSE